MKIPNAAQIAKIQKKVGKKVDVELEKRYEKERKEKIRNLIFIRNTINSIQKEYPDRGACFCIWNNIVYYVDKDTNKTESFCDIKPADIESRKDVELVTIKRDKKFYQVSEEQARIDREIFKWFSEKYADILIAKTSIDRRNEEDPKMIFSSVMRLGYLTEEFQEKFGKSLVEFSEYFKSFDKLFRDSVSGT